MDEKKWELDFQKNDFERQKLVIDAMVRFAEIAIRSLIVLNGGAALALLAFAGNARNPIDAARISRINESVMLFAAGAAAATIIALLAYLSQFIFATKEVETRWYTLAVVLRSAAILLGIVSVVLFLLGAVKASG